MTVLGCWFWVRGSEVGSWFKHSARANARG
jgi:hypothetical protein